MTLSWASYTLPLNSLLFVLKLSATVDPKLCCMFKSTGKIWKTLCPGHTLYQFKSECLLLCLLSKPGVFFLKALMLYLQIFCLGHPDIKTYFSETPKVSYCVVYAYNHFPVIDNVKTSLINTFLNEKFLLLSINLSLWELSHIWQ